MDVKIFLLLSLGVVFSESDVKYERLVSGSASQDAEFPFVTFIYIKDPSTSKASGCVGSIISRKWVLTAAHCFRLKAFETYVFAGTTDLETSKEHIQFRNAVRCVVHDDYIADSWPLVNDVALLEVDYPFVFNEYINLINIGKYFSDTHVYEQCLVAGFGSTVVGEEEELNDVKLFHTLAQAGGQRYCKSEHPFFTWSGHHVCIRPTLPRASMCHGDSGSPLVCEGLLVGTLCGFVYMGTGNETNTCSGYFPKAQYYALTSHFVTWIGKYVHDLPPARSLGEHGSTRGAANYAEGVSASALNVVLGAGVFVWSARVY